MKQKHPMRWIIPIAYVLALAGFLVLLLVPADANLKDSGAVDGVLGTLTAAGAILLLANIVECVVLHASSAPYRRTFSRRAMLLMKLGLIPFFCFGGLMMGVLLLLSIHPVLAVAGWMGALFAAAIGWMVMMSGSVWAIAYAVGLYRDGLMSGGECVVHVLLQFFFVADVIDGIVLFFRGRKKEARYWQSVSGPNGHHASQPVAPQPSAPASPLPQVPPMR